jgi:uncharacterized alkaline shock family protein YloU
MTGELARSLAERVTACPYVAGLSGGPFGAVVTYLPGESVAGVAVREREIEIHLVVEYGKPMPKIAEDVRAAVADLADGRRVDITIADVVDTSTDATKGRSS